MPSSDVRLARVQDPLQPESGRCVLVDRLWPRGRRKDEVSAEWVRDVAPSTELRKWFGHLPERFCEFERLYREELMEPPASEALADLVAWASDGPLTLLTATPDPTCSHAEVLRRVVGERLAHGETAVTDD